MFILTSSECYKEVSDLPFVLGLARGCPEEKCLGASMGAILGWGVSDGLSLKPLLHFLFRKELTLRSWIP